MQCGHYTCSVATIIFPFTGDDPESTLEDYVVELIVAFARAELQVPHFVEEAEFHFVEGAELSTLTLILLEQLLLGKQILGSMQKILSSFLPQSISIDLCIFLIYSCPAERDNAVDQVFFLRCQVSRFLCCLSNIEPVRVLLLLGFGLDE